MSKTEAKEEIRGYVSEAQKKAKKELSISKKKPKKIKWFE